MMFTELDASGYNYNGIFYNAEFEDILSKIVLSYHLMLSSDVVLKNDENKIRDVLYINYLNNDTVRRSIGLQSYFFDRETKEDRSVGRTDLRIITANTFIETAAYYVIECKRLDGINPLGKTGLNAEYIANGMCRFFSKTYSAHYKTNGMIGFVVRPLDIAQNIDAINQLLKTTFKLETSTCRPLEYRDIIAGFDFSYCSLHEVDQSSLLIYHLMLDFASRISQN